MKRIIDFNFFEELLGFSESPETVQNLLSISEEHGTIFLTSAVNSQKLQVGQFSTKMVKEFKKYPSKEGGTFNIVLGNGDWTENYKKIDVGSLQANPSNQGATFQVASNFNCLEFISKTDSAKKGITKYVADQTQGPAASISAMPGTLFRNYFVQHTVDGQVYTGQLEHQINLLDQFPAIPVVNGYVCFSNVHELEFLTEIGTDFHDVEDIKVGVQRNVQVTSGEKRAGKVELCPHKQYINQVFTAAMNLGGIGEIAKHPTAELLARLLLQGGYKATILSAIENSHNQPDHIAGKNKLFLTLIGGGVFGNKYHWITEAILKWKDLIKSSGLQVYLVIYSSHSFDDESLTRLQQLVHETKGKFDLIK